MKQLLCTATLALCLAGPQASMGAETPTPSDDIAVSYDQEAQVAHVTVPVRKGRMQWGDFLRGLARARGFDDKAFDGMWSEKTVRVTGMGGRVILGIIDRIFGPGVEIEIAVDGDTGDGLAEVTLDRRGLLATERRFKQRIKQGLRLVRPDRARYGLVFDDDWSDAPPEKNLVILIHGLQSDSGHIGGILEDVRELGHPCATFDYPNDQPIDESARLLAEELATVAEEHPERKLTLITHSMGGLVARAVIEDPKLDPGNAERLIMVAPPNHGSLLAQLAFGFDFWEYLGDHDKKLAERFFAAIEDGLGEAPDDLRPDSLFLEQLNSRPRNPNVAYSILLGTDAPLSDESLVGLRHSLRKAGDRSRLVRFLGDKLDSYLEDLEEVVRGKGDGAVAVKRGRLQGVSDIELLEFDHLDFSGPHDSPGATLIREAVLKGLAP